MAAGRLAAEQARWEADLPPLSREESALRPGDSEIAVTPLADNVPQSTRGGQAKVGRASFLFQPLPPIGLTMLGAVALVPRAGPESGRASTAHPQWRWGAGREARVRIRAGRRFEPRKDWWELVLDSWQRKGGWEQQGLVLYYFFFYEM